MKSNKLLHLIINIIVFVTFFNTVIVELQMILFNQIIFSNSLIKIFTLFLMVFYLLYSHRLKIKKRGTQFQLFLIIVMLITYMPLCVLINSGTFEDIITILGQNYYFYFLAFFFALTSDEIDIYDLLKKVFYIGLLNGIFCILQYSSDSLLFPFEKYPDGTAIFNSTFFNNSGHTIRAVGFCTSGFDCGVLLVFSAIYAFVCLIKNKRITKKILHIMHLLILAYAIYTTKTRNIYLMCLYCFVFLLMYFVIKNRRIQNLFSKAMPIMLIVMFGVIFFSGSLLNGSQNATNIFSVNTILIRFGNWTSAFKDFGAHPLNFIFGFGKSQVTNIVTDNIYIDTIYTFGCLGLVMFCAFWINCTYSIFKLRNESNFNIYFYVIISSVFVIGFGNLISQIYGFIAIILPLIEINKNTKKDLSYET